MIRHPPIRTRESFTGLPAAPRQKRPAVRTHPLAAVAGHIDPDGRYTVKDLATMTGRSTTRVSAWGRGGHLGEPDWEDSMAAGSGRRRVWPGTVLLAALAAAPPVQDHDHREPTDTWVLGCRRDDCDCREHHNAQLADARRRRTQDAVPPKARRVVLRLVGQGRPLPDATAAADTTVPKINALARIDPTFRADLARARETLCQQRYKSCGTPTGWRSGCRGTACLHAHNSTFRAPATPDGGC